MPLIRQYNNGDPIQASDAFVIDRIGSGTMYVLASAFISQFSVVDMLSPTSAPYSLINGNLCNVHSSVAPQVGNLPPAVTGGLYIEFMDYDNDLNTNLATINAHGSDVIKDYATSAATKTLTLANGVWRFIPYNGVWRVLNP